MAREKRTTPLDRESIKALKDRLDAEISEHRRMREEMEALQRRQPLDQLRSALRRQMDRMRDDDASKD